MDLLLLQSTQSSVPVACPRLAWHMQGLLWQQHPVGAHCSGGIAALAAGRDLSWELSPVWGVFRAHPEVCAALERAELRFNVLWKALSTGGRGGSAAKSLRSRLVSIILPLQGLFWFPFILFFFFWLGCRACETGVLPGNWRWATCAGKQQQGKRREREWMWPFLHCSWARKSSPDALFFCICSPNKWLLFLSRQDAPSWWIIVIKGAGHLEIIKI